MATTIDKLDLSVYNLYAIRTRMIEQTNQQMRLDQAATVAPQLQVVDNFPKMSELDLLLGIVPLFTPWAFFYPPLKFHNTRRSAFGFFRVAPSIGSLEQQEKQEAIVDSIECRSADEVAEKNAIKKCFQQMGEINRWLGHIVGRVGQFLQG